MPEPVPWQDDPKCGHDVLCEYQTHYCTYIRVPRLLTLQNPLTDNSDEIESLVALQANELWFKVLISDLHAVLAALTEGPTDRYGPLQSLHRSAKIISLLERQAELHASFLADSPGLQVEIVASHGALISPQFAELHDRSRRLEEALETASSWPALMAAASNYLTRFWEWEARFRRLLSKALRLVGSGAPSYTDYTAAQALTSLQDGVKGDWAAPGQCPERHVPTDPLSADELLFIVVHQTFELWFRALLHELDHVSGLLQLPEPQLPAASHRMRRAAAIQKFLTDQILIPATMLPMDFLRFRDETKLVGGTQVEKGLSPASGTESYQYREIEILAGLKTSVSYREFLAGTESSHTRFLTPAQRARFERPSLAELFDALLAARGLDSVLKIFAPSDQPNPHADLAELADLLLEFDQYFHLWRVNHLTMVQSMIGRKSGTGFLGPEYLKETTGMGLQGEDDRIFATPQVRPRFFERLWEARTRMQTAGKP